MKPDVSVTDDERRRCRGVLKQGGTAEETFGSFVLAVFLDYVLIHGYDAWSKVFLFLNKGVRRGAGGFL